MNQEKRTAISQINTTLERLIIRFGFTPTRDGLYVNVEQGRNDYGCVQINERLIYDDRKGTHLITAKASVCQMNPNASTDELRWAADQIHRAAGLADAIDALELHYMEEAPTL